MRGLLKFAVGVLVVSAGYAIKRIGERVRGERTVPEYDGADLFDRTRASEVKPPTHDDMVAVAEKMRAMRADKGLN